MGFGYIPRPRFWQNLALWLIGYPSIIRRIQAPVLMKLIGPEEGMHILDGGCGIGYFTGELARRHAYAWGIDIALSKYACYMTKVMPRLYLIKGDIEYMPIKDSRFDRIVLSSVLQAVDDDELLLRECWRTLKMNGYLVLSASLDYVFMKWLQANKTMMKDKFHIRGRAYYGFDELIALLSRTGFEIDQWEYSPGRFGSFLYECALVLTYRFKIRNCEPFLFLLFAPFLGLDKCLFNGRKGDEIVIRARKC